MLIHFQILYNTHYVTKLALSFFWNYNYISVPVPLYALTLGMKVGRELSPISQFDWQLRYCSYLAWSAAVHNPEGKAGEDGRGEEKLAAVPKWLCLENGISDICLADKNHHQIWGREGQCPCHQIAMVWHLVWRLPPLRVDQESQEAGCNAEHATEWNSSAGDIFGRIKKRSSE